MEPLAIGGLVVHREVTAHELLGQAHVIEFAGRAITAMSALDWERPSEIPAVAEPGRLPPGAGGALLNEIARRAERAGMAALRYAGPYPTPALYRTLVRSFRASASEEVFTRDVMARALRIARDPVPVEFAPAPHRRIELACGHAEVRDGVEAATIGGTRCERGGAIARIVGGDAANGDASDDVIACEVWFGDAPYARLAELSPRGELVSGPYPTPALLSRVVGQEFPPPLCAALAELVAEAVPEPLAADARRAVAERSLVWADLGTRAASRTDEGFAVHAALWERLAPHGLARVALGLTEALAPIVTAWLVAELLARARPGA